MGAAAAGAPPRPAAEAAAGSPPTPRIPAPTPETVTGLVVGGGGPTTNSTWRRRRRRNSGARARLVLQGRCSTSHGLPSILWRQVFRVYGYVLPVLLASMLVTTGPQAFLMAMAIPLAQSVLSFAISKIGSFGRRRRDEEEYDDDGYYYSDYGSGGWEAEEQYRSNSSSTYRGDSSTTSSRYQQQQQESADSHPTAEPGDINGTTGTATRSESGSISFGGWDELEEGDDRRRSSRWSAGASPVDTATAGGAVGTSRPPATRRRRSRGAAAARYRQAPLPMRLLIALFPFLGSWFRIML
ncbi:uncharacterized protein LOC125515367 isoform X2 [Triticum urartu]|uniref:uncharacterized protein LOC125515349 isoform X1 n=1 Tax=Triticum urartu TaxID=4572 RepID=UPI0020436497|nr:uncharacterized protein LOC125515349 isoform X1 [Triticum urartu]XP_048536794.1 uncharacterized protein LOC125515367 isoform X2 [Triticum urartu]